MLGYVTSFAGNDLVSSSIGQSGTTQQKSVSPSRARILGGAMYDLDGLATYGSEQTFTARFRDKDPNTWLYTFNRYLGRAGWLTIQTSDSVYTSVYNWAKIISIDGESTPDGFANTSKFHEYSVTWSCSPYWYETTDRTQSFTAVTSTTTASRGSARSTWWALYITSAITSPLTITLSQSNVFTYGTMTYNENPLSGAIYLASTSQSIIYNGTKAAGSVLAIDARTNSVTLNGNDVYSNITLPATQANLGYMYNDAQTRFTFSSSVTGSLVWRYAFT